MISFDEAFQIVIDIGEPTGTEKVALSNALTRILAEDVISDTDIPPFNKSAMDGFACRKTDLACPLEIIEEIPAGTISNKKIEKGQCSRIMTGAMVPEGADFILMKEHSELTVSGKIVCLKESLNANICYRGEDVKSGEIVLKKGSMLLPQHVAVLATVGCIKPLVYLLPSVAVISTGNELIEPSEMPGGSQIRNSNAYQISAQLQKTGLSPVYLGIAEDNEISLENLLEKALSENQIIIISGGVSVGDYDYVPKVLKKLGVEIKFHGINAKPGKHILFGIKDKHYVLGLPGNPVSSFVQFELLVKPLIYNLIGYKTTPFTLYLPLEKEYKRKKSDGLSFIPVGINSGGNVEPLEYHGSAHIHSYISARGIMEIPDGISEIKKGDKIRVRPLL